MIWDATQNQKNKQKGIWEQNKQDFIEFLIETKIKMDMLCNIYREREKAVGLVLGSSSDLIRSKSQRQGQRRGGKYDLK